MKNNCLHTNQLKTFVPITQSCNLHTVHDIMSSLQTGDNALWLLLYKKLYTLQAACDDYAGSNCCM